MTVYSEILGNTRLDPEWKANVEALPNVEYIHLDQWMAQKSRFLGRGDKGGEYPVALRRQSQVKDGDVILYDPARGRAAVLRLDLSPVLEIDLGALEPTVSYPHLPENTHLASEGKDIKIDQVVIGSCTNGRLEDMEAAYNVLKGKHIAKGVRGIIIPATMAVYKECILRGWTTAFIDAGCIVSTPTCGPCLGGYMGILAEGERCVSTTNRNFVGRMGHVKSEVYLASPATAAASALTGCITDPRTV